MYEVHGRPLMAAVSSYRCSRVPASRGRAACCDTRCSMLVCWSASSSKYAAHLSRSSVGEKTKLKKRGTAVHDTELGDNFQLVYLLTKCGMLPGNVNVCGVKCSVTFSPSRTSKGTLFMPPLTHSSRVTVPLPSTSIAVIMSLSTCAITKIVSI